MDFKSKVILGCAVIMAASFIYISIQGERIDNLTSERDRYKANTDVLMSDIKTYIVRDSLNGARADALELSMKELQKWRAEDAELIKDLKIKNRDLSAINKAQTQTIIELWARGKDTIIVRDSIVTPAQAYHCGDRWYNFDCIVADNELTGNLAVRDSLVLVEQVKYKYFLWWKTKKIKDRKIDAISLCPYTSIMGVERIIIE